MIRFYCDNMWRAMPNEKGTTISLFRFQNRLTIVDGATGFLRAHGLLNFASGEIKLTFNGRICVEN